MNEAYRKVLESARQSNEAIRARGWAGKPPQVKVQDGLDRNQETLQALLQSGKTMTVSEMVQQTGIKKAEAYRAVTRLKTSGFLRMVRADKFGKHYRAANAGRQMPDLAKCESPQPKEAEGRYTVKIDAPSASAISDDGATRHITLAGCERITQEVK